MAAAAATSLTFNQLFVANATAAVAHKNAETTEKRETDRKRKKKKMSRIRNFERTRLKSDFVYISNNICLFIMGF